MRAANSTRNAPTRCGFSHQLSTASRFGVRTRTAAATSNKYSTLKLQRRLNYCTRNRRFAGGYSTSLCIRESLCRWNCSNGVGAVIGCADTRDHNRIAYSKAVSISRSQRCSGARHGCFNHFIATANIGCSTAAHSRRSSRTTTVPTHRTCTRSTTDKNKQHFIWDCWYGGLHATTQTTSDSCG